MSDNNLVRELRDGCYCHKDFHCLPCCAAAEIERLRELEAYIQPVLKDLEDTLVDRDALRAALRKIEKEAKWLNTGTWNAAGVRCINNILRIICGVGDITQEVGGGLTPQRGNDESENA